MDSPNKLAAQEAARYQIPNFFRDAVSALKSAASPIALEERLRQIERDGFENKMRHKVNEILERDNNELLSAKEFWQYMREFKIRDPYPLFTLPSLH